MTTPRNGNGLAAGHIIGKYKLSRRLGEGGSGEIWKARDQIEGIWVALKLPLARLDGTIDEASIRKEIRLVASLRHPCIMPIKMAA